MTLKRYRSPTVSVDVDVCLDQFETDDLVAELKHRQKGETESPYSAELQEIHAAVSAGRRADALSMIERIISPKWRSIEQCEADLRKAQAAQVS